jgi:hypothetical protein
MEHSIMRGWSVINQGDNDYAKIISPDDKLSTLSKMMRMLRAIKKQNI